jgi:hypothetical protein
VPLANTSGSNKLLVFMVSLNSIHPRHKRAAHQYTTACCADAQRTAVRK